MEIVKITLRTPTEIVFASIEDMVKFHDEITDGKAVIFDFVNKSKRYGELVNPIIKADISDSKIKIRSEEDINGTF
jgi:hypothetical protein